MDHAQFAALAAQGYDRIPLTLETYADLDTPLSLYLKLANLPNSFLLESVVGGERFGRYSFIGLPARRLLRSRGFATEVVEDGAVIERDDGNPLDFIERYQQRQRVYVPPDMQRFCGGLAGYFGYDAVRYIEPRLARFDKPDEIGTPDLLLLETQELAVVDNLAGKIYLIVYVDPAAPDAYAAGQARLRTLLARLRSPLVPPASPPGAVSESVRGFAKADFLAAVARAKDYIAAGDLMQVQVGQRIRTPFAQSPLTLYRALRSLNPSPYMYFYDFGEFQVVGASPEILVRQEATAAGTRVTIRPLAGTRPRGATPEEDRRLADELLADPKERAEHVMLIDLARNDIGRIAQIGSVEVTDEMVIERYSHVMHIVSNVEGLLRSGMGNLDVLRASFPAGTLTGAPKVRAMELIDELEPVKRGIYGGACGYLSYSGDMDVAIAIRTGIVKDGQLYVQAAAGIVADSVPESEWQETENKARALLRAAEMAQAGLDAVA
ncbi:MAG TPA: anthranilate synthase component I [Immundisolibacter sp.]|nr:anthranilate synthase component I [Immundisolibacter sp.]